MGTILSKFCREPFSFLTKNAHVRVLKNKSVFIHIWLYVLINCFIRIYKPPLHKHLCFKHTKNWYLDFETMPEITKTKLFHEYMNEYRKQMEIGYIQEAYKGLMKYIMELKSYFNNKYPNYSVSGGIYYGYMDMTYFALFPEPLKRQKLKVAIVFIHDTCRFEVWLAGANKQVQTKYWKLLKESDWNKYHIPSTIKGVDSIIEYVLVESPDFSDLDTLTEQIERGTLEFIKDVENFLSKN